MTLAHRSELGDEKPELWRLAIDLPLFQRVIYEFYPGSRAVFIRKSNHAVPEDMAGYLWRLRELTYVFHKAETEVMKYRQKKKSSTEV